MFLMVGFPLGELRGAYRGNRGSVCMCVRNYVCVDGVMGVYGVHGAQI